MKRLGIEPKYDCFPDTRTSWYYLWRERRLPINVDPFDSRLDDELERVRLRRVFEHGLSSPVGYALPICRESSNGGKPGWASSAWFLRDERMNLIPGDSPMGYRLPLDSLPWAAPEDRPWLEERDPFAPRAAASVARRYPCPICTACSRRRIRRRRLGSAAGRLRTSGACRRTLSDDRGEAAAVASPDRAPLRFESATGITHTALCVEVRDPRRASGPAAEAKGSQTGVLYVFMPPLPALEDYLALLAAVEATAADLGMRIDARGLPAAARPAPQGAAGHARSGSRSKSTCIRRHSWAELVDHTAFLYEAARLVATVELRSSCWTGGTREPAAATTS